MVILLGFIMIKKYDSCHKDKEVAVTRLFQINIILLLLCFVSCSQYLELHKKQAGGGMRIVVANYGQGGERSIAPTHATLAELRDPAKYRLELTGTTGFQNLPATPITLSATGTTSITTIPEGVWELVLTAYNPQNVAVLRGATTVEKTALNAPDASFVLKAVLNGTGSVDVRFVLPPDFVKRLNPQSVKVALYYATTNALVAGTEQGFAASNATANTTIAYSRTNVPEGEYRIRLTGVTQVNNGSTNFETVSYTVGYEDVLYVESGRTSAATITIAATNIGVPGRPFEASKRSQNFTVASSNSTAGFSGANITGSQSFSPYGEGLWIYAANWDGHGGNTPTTPAGPNGGHAGSTQGNEVLLVTWDAVYDADYYELEMLLHPNYGYNNNSGVSNSAKYEKLPVNDSDWNQFLQRNPRPIQLRFSGKDTDFDYYKTKTYTHTIARDSTAKNVSFTFMAWRDLARGKNNGYSTATSSTNGNFIGSPDTSGVSRRGSASYRIGLEGDCDALAILMNNFTPQHWYGIRVRGVNQYGQSDWVYWKGGKN